MSGLTGQNAEHNMQSLFGTNGEYNKRKESSNGVVDFANPKRMRSEYFPGGRFDDNGAGPTGVLGQHGGRPEGMSKNLSTNQTEKTLYVNIPRFIVPVMLPNPQCGGSRPYMSLKKSVVAGDVVFHLRYNSHMIDCKVATDVNTKTAQGQMAFTINLPTVNYIIMNLHKYLLLFKDIMLDMTGSGVFQDIKQYFKGATDIINNTGNGPQTLTGSGMQTWHVFFRNVSFDSGPDSFARLMLTNLTNNQYPINGNFFGRWLQKVQTSFVSGGGKVLSLEVKKNMLSKYIAKIVWHFIRSYIKVAGVFIGSDNQGGNDQGENNPCSFLSTDYVGTIQVAGKTLKAKNLWSWCKPGIRSGDVLGFRLAAVSVPEKKVQFSLSSNPAIPHTADLNTAHSTQNDKLDIAPLVLIPCVLDRPLCPENPNTLDFVETIPYFMQFGISNQISKQFNQSSDQMLYATNACASSDLMYIEIFMRFNVIEVSRDYTAFVHKIREGMAAAKGSGVDVVSGGSIVVADKAQAIPASIVKVLRDIIPQTPETTSTTVSAPALDTRRRVAPKSSLTNTPKRASDENGV